MTGLSLEQLGALNDQIAALLRAGIPLEAGLARIGGDGRDGGARMAREMSESLARGESLEQFLAEHPRSFPPVYRAVVSAGVRGGRLSLALEQLATTSRRLAQLRRAVGYALSYPLLLAAVAYPLLMFYGTKVAPVLSRTWLDAYGKTSSYLQAVETGARWTAGAGYLPPLVAGLFLFLVWWKSGRATLLDAPWRVRFLGWIPGLSRILADGRGAVLAEVSGLLVGQSVPLPEALRAAAAVTGEPRLASDVERLCASLERGGELSRAVAERGSIPSLFAWYLVLGQSQGRLAERLHQLAETLHRRAADRVETFAIVAPVFFTATFGLLLTISYAVAVLWPWFHLMERLAAP